MAEYEQLTLPFAQPDDTGRKKTSRARRAPANKAPFPTVGTGKQQNKKTAAGAAAKKKKEPADKTTGKAKPVAARTSRAAGKGVTQQAEKTPAKTAGTREKSHTKTSAQRTAAVPKESCDVPDAIREALLALPAEKRFAVKEAFLEAQPPQVGFYISVRKILAGTEGALRTGSARGVYAAREDGTKCYSMWYPALKLIESLILHGDWISAAEERRVYRAKTALEKEND